MGPIWRGVTDSTGEFGTNNFREGTYVVEAAARGFHKERRIVILKVNDALRLDIGLILGELTYTPPIAVTGLARDVNGKPLPRVLLNDTCGIQFASTDNRQNGCSRTLCFFVSTPGEYEIILFPANYRRSTVVLASLSQRANQTLDIWLH